MRVRRFRRASSYSPPDDEAIGLLLDPDARFASRDHVPQNEAVVPSVCIPAYTPFTCRLVGFDTVIV